MSYHEQISKEVFSFLGMYYFLFISRRMKGSLDNLLLNFTKEFFILPIFNTSAISFFKNASVSLNSEELSVSQFNKVRA
jgi:hypothetical protein